MRQHSVKDILQKDSDSNWHYVHIPQHIREDYKAIEKRGIIPVIATLEGTTWDGSLLPWADGSAQLSLPAKVRNKEKVHEGDSIELVILPRH